MPDWLADLHGATYAPWASDMSERSDILFPLVIDVVVFDVALDLARRDHGIEYDRRHSCARHSSACRATTESPAPGICAGAVSNASKVNVAIHLVIERKDTPSPVRRCRIEI